MKISITDKAHNFFKTEVDPQNGKGIRFLGKTYGETNVHDNFSVAMQVASPKDPLATTEKDGITYFAEKSDDWFFNGYDFEVDYDEEAELPVYHFEPKA